MPTRHRSTLSAQSLAMRCAAHVQMILVDQWVEDQVEDGRGAVALAQPWTRSHRGPAHTALSALGFELRVVDQLSPHQSAIEKLGQTTPLDAAQPTMESLGSLLEQVPDLPGAPAQLSERAIRVTLGALGRNLGLIIYLIDALQDLKDDLLHGDFNPCLHTGPMGTEISEHRLDECCSLLDHAVEELGRCVQSLPWRRHQSLLSGLLSERVPELAANAKTRGRHWISPAGRWTLARLRASSRLTRARAHLSEWWNRLAGLARQVLARASKRIAAAPREGEPGSKKRKKKTDSGDCFFCCDCSVCVEAFCCLGDSSSDGCCDCCGACDCA